MIELEDTTVFVYNREGMVVWCSRDDSETKVGDYAWSHVPAEHKERMKSVFARTVATGAPFTDEAPNEDGEWFRAWIWPVPARDFSVCIVRVKLPALIGRLSTKERELLGGMASGKTVRQLASWHGISISTVHTYLRRVREKLELQSLESVFGFAARYCIPLPENVEDSEFLHALESANEPHSDHSELLSRMKGTHAMICDWQGTIQWLSRPGIMAQVGDNVSKYAHPDTKEKAREAMARCITLREPQLGESFNERGEFYRIFSWPLLSPQAAIFVLMVNLPKELATLTQRERQMLELLSTGNRAKEIAEILDMSTTTIHAGLKTAREKLGLPNQESLVAFSARHCHPGEIPLPIRDLPIAGMED